MPNSQRALDGGGAALDPRRVDQHLHGAVPRVRGRPAPAARAHARLRDAEPVHRAGRGDRVGAAMDAHQLVRGRPPATPGTIPGHGAALVLHRRRRRSSGPCSTRFSPRAEHPPADMAAFQPRGRPTPGIAAGTREIVAAVRTMPETMRQLALVQVFTWLGLFCMWLYFPVAVARDVFGAPDASLAALSAGRGVGGVCFGAYSAVLLRLLVLPAAAGPLSADARGRTRSACWRARPGCSRWR